jgi:hypothetical protein
LRDDARRRGDHTFSVVLSGVELYVSLGREFELLELMKQFAEDMRESVENTPTAEELRRLFNQEPPKPQS